MCFFGVASDTDAVSVAPAQVLLRWASQRGIAVIPKSNNHDRLVQNLKHTDFTLEEADIEKLTSLDQNARWVSSSLCAFLDLTMSSVQLQRPGQHRPAHRYLRVSVAQVHS